MPICERAREGRGKCGWIFHLNIVLLICFDCYHVFPSIKITAHTLTESCNLNDRQKQCQETEVNEQVMREKMNFIKWNGNERRRWWWWRWRQWKKFELCSIIMSMFFVIVATVTTPMLTHIVLCIFPLKFFVFIAFSNENKPHVISNVLEVSRKATAWRFYINTSSSLIDWVMNKARKKNITLSQSHTHAHAHTYVRNNSLENVIKSTLFLIEHNSLILHFMCE